MDYEPGIIGNQGLARNSVKSKHFGPENPRGVLSGILRGFVLSSKQFYYSTSLDALLDRVCLTFTENYRVTLEEL